VDSPDRTAASDSFPTSDELDGMADEQCQSQLVSIVGRAAAFLARLVAERPFGSDEGLMATAYRLVRELPEADLVELVSARPRDASATGVIAAHRENDEEAEGDWGDGAWVEEELASLEEVYRARFGFPFAVFDAGRPRAEIIPLLEASLRNDREAELRRAAADCIALAEDRLRRLRGASPGRVDDE
jgi:2-oxo-4-hydroxy-4-carboxy-5-ureidoimidazoline decarboxylase